MQDQGVVVTTYLTQITMPELGLLMGDVEATFFDLFEGVTTIQARAEKSQDHGPETCDSTSDPWREHFKSELPVDPLLKKFRTASLQGSE